MAAARQEAETHGTWAHGIWHMSQRTWHRNMSQRTWHVPNVTAYMAYGTCHMTRGTCHK